MSLASVLNWLESSTRAPASSSSFSFNCCSCCWNCCTNWSSCCLSCSFRRTTSFSAVGSRIGARLEFAAGFDSAAPAARPDCSGSQPARLPRPPDASATAVRTSAQNHGGDARSEERCKNSSKDKHGHHEEGSGFLDCNSPSPGKVSGARLARPAAVALACRSLVCAICRLCAAGRTGDRSPGESRAAVAAG